MNEIAQQINRQEIDCNNQQLFFQTLIRGLLLDLNSKIVVQGVPVPHIVFNSGDDTFWLIEKDYDFSKEPCEVTNEQYIYSQVPRCAVTIGSMDMVPDQLTNKYVRGNFQFEKGDNLYTFNAEFIRFPIKININLKYVLSSLQAMFEMMQHIITKLAFVQTYKFVYMGQTMLASYKVPESAQDEHLTEISGDTQESRDRIVELQLEVESNIPVFSPKTVVEAAYISHPIQSLQINNNEPIQRDFASGSGYRGPGFGKH